MTSKKWKCKIFCLTFINLSHYFCSFTMEGKQAHCELLFSPLDKELQQKNISIECTSSIVHENPWKWFHHNIGKLIKDDEFVNSMNDSELRLWISFVDVMKNLGNRLAKNDEVLVEMLLKNQQDIDANISIKVYFLHSHLDKFSDNYDDVRDKQGERFMRISKQWKSATRNGGTNEWWLTTAEISKRAWITLNMSDYQWREIFYHSSYVHEGFISWFDENTCWFIQSFYF